MTTNMDPRSNQFTFNSGSQHWSMYSKQGVYQPSRYDSGLGSLPSMSTEPPRPPKLIGGAAAILEEQCESGVFSGDVSMFCGEDADADGRVHNDQQVPIDSEFSVNSVLPPSKQLESLSISDTNSREPEVLRTVRMEKPLRVSVTAEKTNSKSSRPRVRRPHKNYSSNSARSSTSSPPNSGGLQSLPTNHPADLGNNNSGIFTSLRAPQLPQSWDTGYSGSQPSSMSSIDNFSGNSAMNMPWPTIDIFELQQNVQYFLPNRDGDT